MSQETFSFTPGKPKQARSLLNGGLSKRIDCASRHSGRRQVRVGGTAEGAGLQHCGAEVSGVPATLSALGRRWLRLGGVRATGCLRSQEERLCFARLRPLMVLGDPAALVVESGGAPGSRDSPSHTVSSGSSFAGSGVLPLSQRSHQLSTIAEPVDARARDSRRRDSGGHRGRACAATGFPRPREAPQHDGPPGSCSHPPSPDMMNTGTFTLS